MVMSQAQVGVVQNVRGGVSTYVLECCIGELPLSTQVKRKDSKD